MNLLSHNSVDQNQGVIKAVFFPQGSREKSASGLIQVVGRIVVLGVVRLRSLFPCWLLLRESFSSSRSQLHFLALSSKAVTVGQASLML